MALFASGRQNTLRPDQINGLGLGDFGQGDLAPPQIMPTPGVWQPPAEQQQAMRQIAEAPPIQAQTDGKRGFFDHGIGSLLRGALGGALDGVATYYGAQPGYSTSIQRQNEQAVMLQKLMLDSQMAAQAKAEQRRAANEDWMTRYNYEAQHPKQQDDSFTRALAAAGIQPGSAEYVALAKRRAEMLTNPVQIVPDGMGGMTPVRPYGGNDAPDVLDPDTVRNLMGGGVSNGTGNFQP